MSTSQVHARRLSVAAIAVCGLVGLSACSGGSSSASSSAPSMATSSTLPTTSTTSNSPAASSSTQSSSAAASSSAQASKPTSSKPTSSSAKASKSTKAAAKPDPVAACKTANSQSNQAISQWNTAVNSQSKSKLKSAAHNFSTVAGGLRKLPAKAGDKGFTSRVKAVANDLDAMAKNQSAGKSVDPSKYNTDSETLRTYCQKILTSN